MHPISEVLCEAYNKLHEVRQVSFPLHEENRQALDSVVKTVNATYFGFDRFPTSKDKAAAYFCLIIKDHPVTDGNKRLSVLWLRVYCTVHKLNPKTSPYYAGLDELAIAIEDSDLGMDDLMKAVKYILFS